MSDVIHINKARRLRVTATLFAVEPERSPFPFDAPFEEFRDWLKAVAFAREAANIWKINFIVEERLYYGPVCYDVAETDLVTPD